MSDQKDVSVLVVDDESSIRKVMCTILELEGFKLFSAESGNDALEIVKSEKIDFVISDIRMPNGDGVELLENIKKEVDSNQPAVCLMTGFSKFSKKEILSKGAVDLLDKPPNFDKIISLIETSTAQ